MKVASSLTVLSLTTLSMEKKAKEQYTKIAGAHPRPQFSVDERKCTETNNVLETTRCYQRQFFLIRSEDGADKH